MTRQLYESVYDRLCAVLTDYEQDGVDMYEEIVNIVNDMAETLN